MNRVAKNQFGVCIKLQCASCANKEVDNDGTRICQVMKIKVEQQSVCPRWQMSDQAGKAGCSMGRVKRREYLQFVFTVRMQERDLLKNGQMKADEVATPDSLRERFEKETGLTPFIIH